MKRTYQPKIVRRKRTHGFRLRSATPGGRRILANRRRKGRKRLTVWGMGGNTFRKSERLRFRSQFAKTLEEGQKKRVGAFCTVFYIPNNLNRVRLGIIASKKIGNAVSRNRAKRRIREVFRGIKSRVSPAMDIVIISGKDLILLPFSTLERRILQVFIPNFEI